jgi:hypothetical protein
LRAAVVLALAAGTIHWFPPVAGVSQPVASGCIGDCDDDGVVSIDNVILMINVALGTAPAGACAAGDADANGRIAIDELVAAVHAALVRCPAPTPTRRPTLPPLPALIVPTPGAVLRDVTVINPGVSRHERQTVTILGNTITSVEDRSGEDFSGSEQGHGEFRGRYVLPGLIDMHVHTPDGLLDTQLFMMLYLAHGVTTVRDTGNATGRIFDYRQMIESGQFPGPRIFACGSILDGPPPVWPNSCVVSDADTAEGCVRTQAAKGASCIKVYNNLSEASLGEIRRAAKTMGLPLIGHIPLAVPLERAGVADVQHLTGVPSVPYSAGAHYWDWFVGAWEQLDDARRDLIVRTSLEQGIAHTPTLTVFDRLSRVLADYDVALDDPAAQLLPRYYRESCPWNPRCNRSLAAVSPHTTSAFPAVIARMKDVVRQLHAAGVEIRGGSDTLNPFVVPGASMHEELRHLHEAGLNLEELWIVATRTAGAALGDSLLGTIQTGAPADALLFREDPTQSIANLATLEAVIAQGRLYGTGELFRLIRGYRNFLDALFDRAAVGAGPVPEHRCVP